MRWSRVVAAGRIIFGMGLMLLPGFTGRIWLGEPADGAVMRYHSRINGGREAALGLSLLATTEHPAAMRRLLWIGAVFDTWDGYTALTARGSLTGFRRLHAILVPLIWVALAVAAAVRVQRP